MPSNVTAVTAATPALAEAHFSARLTFETDCWDVHDAMVAAAWPISWFSMWRARGAYATGHVAGPRCRCRMRRLTKRACRHGLAKHCSWSIAPARIANGANRAGPSASPGSGAPVKEMIGGITGWADEGFGFASGEKPRAALRDRFRSRLNRKTAQAEGRNPPSSSPSGHPSDPRRDRSPASGHRCGATTP